jgi:SAM-dependent methyltransferase
MKYYNEEYAPTNMGALDNSGDRPGSKNYFTIKRYLQLYDFVKPVLTKNSFILDVGCAMGGFLDYLNQQGLNNLFGIDLTQKYVDYANDIGKYTIKLGNAESIPFDRNTFDLIVIDQVMEHLVEPTNAFKEAKRVLKDGGFLCIGVPDATRYDEMYFFDFYWFIMREHIQHFDIEHLRIMAEDTGFELVSLSKSEAPMMSDSMILPNLNAIFRLTNSVVKKTVEKNMYFKLQDTIKKYIANDTERLSKKKETIEQLKRSQKQMYVWGIGREFLYLYEQAGLKYCDITALIDANPYKQANVTLEKKRIADPSILKNATRNSVVLITAIAHKDAIKKSLGNLGYNGEIAEL